MPPHIYVAGPFTGPHAYAIHCNVERAEAVALEVWRVGGVGVCPHSLGRNFVGTLPESVWLAGGLSLLAKCDALVLVEGYERSSGTKAEVAYALDHNIPVFFSVEELAQWMMEKGTYREYVR